MGTSKAVVGKARGETPQKPKQKTKRQRAYEAENAPDYDDEEEHAQEQWAREEVNEEAQALHTRRVRCRRHRRRRRVRRDFASSLADGSVLRGRQSRRRGRVDERSLIELRAEEGKVRLGLLQQLDHARPHLNVLGRMDDLIAEVPGATRAEHVRRVRSGGSRTRK